MSSDKSPDGSEGESIKVILRIRPPDKSEGEVASQSPIESLDSRIIVHTKPEKVFTFDKIADTDITQEAVFCNVGKSIIDSCLNGYNGTIFAYGQTGSGKTFTMIGPYEESDCFQHEKRGVIPRGFEYLFSRIAREKELIYHEQVYDLLDASAQGLLLRENIKKGVFVDGLREETVTNASEAYQVLQAGWINRRVAATSMNRESSRSHAVFTLFIESKEFIGGVENVRMSQLNLVDLAGSERQRDTKASGKRLKEAGSINKSLSTLGNCIMALVDITHGKTRHVAYRDSKLTFLLRDSLGGNAKTNIVACIHAGARFLGETLSTLQFAQRAKMIKNKAIVNEDTQGSVQHLQAEIRRLKEMLSQYKSDDVPRPLENCSEGAVHTTSVGSKGGDGEWRNNFLEAMFFRQRAEMEKQTLMQEIKELEEIRKKREKFNQSREMVMKFRLKDIEILKKEIAKLKSQLARENGENTKDIEVEKEDEKLNRLKEENKVLTERINCHPMVIKQNMQIEKLRVELKQIKSVDNHRQTVLGDNTRVEELDRVFKELMTEKNKDADKIDKKLTSPYTTPRSPDNVAVATVEKYKSQVANLQKELESIKATLTETRESYEKKVIELKAELSSANQMNEELARSLKTRQKHYDIEKQMITDMHNRTIETITTPQKARYNLRNRAIMGSPLVNGGSPDRIHSPEGEPVSDLNQTIEMEEGLVEEGHQGIMTETTEVMNDALTDEIKHLQEANRKLSERLEEYEGDTMKDRQELHKLSNKIQQLNDILSKERSDWTSTRKEFEKKNCELEEELRTTKEEARVFKEEAQDIRVMISYTDKENDELRKRSKEAEDLRQKTVSTLDTQMMKLTLEFEQLEKVNEDLNKENDMAQEQLENSQLTLQFKDDCILEMEEKMKSLQQEASVLASNIQELEGKLEQKDGEMSTLHAQLVMDSASSKQQTVELLEEITALKSVNSQLSAEVEKRSNNEASLKQELVKACVNVTNLEKELAKGKESVASLWNTIQDQKSTLSQQKDEESKLESKLTNKKQELDALQKTSSVNLQEIERLEAENTTLREGSLQAKSKFEVEMSILQDSMEEMSEQQERTHQELQDTRNELLTSQSLCTKLSEEVESLNRKLKREEEEGNISENTLTELKELINKNEIDLQEKNEAVSSLTQDLGHLRSEKSSMDDMCCQLETDLQAARAEVSLLESNIKENLQLVETAKVESIHAKQVSENAQTAKEQMSEKLEETEVQLQTLRDENNRLTAVATKDREDKSRLHSELEVLREHFSQSQAELEEKQEKIQSLEEDLAKFGGHQNLKQKIKLFQKNKEEKFELEQVVRTLKSENHKLLIELSQHRPATPKHLSKTPIQNKENMRPGSQSSNCHRTMSATRSHQERQTLFMSGEYSTSDSLIKAQLEASSSANRIRDGSVGDSSGQ